MNLTHGNLRIRNATVEDAQLLCRWWNDGSVMAHAGFPRGLGISTDSVRKQIEAESDETVRRHIIELDGSPIGEMNYRDMGSSICEIGIKICDPSFQNRGFGKVILSLFLNGLFHDLRYQKVCLDTNLNNKRAQHVYEQLGFLKIRENIDSWTDQLGQLQSSVDYELTADRFIDFR